ncbi:carbohydrate ABC transporter substrate-binding protein [halophilic archaeon]|nr:carbohydrate ABC transporter substrate-binding protein [halophilic archaeon]
MNGGRHWLSRRGYVKRLAGAVGLAGLAGSSRAQQGQTLEIVHWWTAGGEEEALNALLDGFTEQNPQVEINNNPAPGGAGSALDAVIRNRIVNQNPPSTFQIWPGESLTPYVESDVLVDIGDSVWGQGMRDAYLESVQSVSQPAGNFVAVPINIHRLNNLFYNIEVVESAGVDPTNIDSPDALVGAMETVQSETDAIGMAHQTQSPWSTVQLWETVFIGQHGPQAFQRFLNGNASDQEDQIKSSLELVSRYSEFFPQDSGSVTWDQANARVIDGDAAFIHQGDWAAGQYRAQEGFEYQDQWNYVPFPGTQGAYSMVIDSFVYPDNNPSPDATEAFLNYCGSVDAQERFNPVKGSIPPRTDVPDDEFGPFLTQQKQDFADSDNQPLTVAHGSGVDPETKTAIEETFSGFNEQFNVDATYQGIVNAFN